MKVRCIRLFDAFGREVDSSPWLTVGRSYHVMSIEVTSRMFQWAGLPAAGTEAGWLTPAGVVLRANAAVTGWGANKATQPYLDSSNR